MVVLWLLPPVVVTLVAMGWVAWLGRESRGEVDRDQAVRRLGAALDPQPSRWRPWARSRPRPGYAVAPRTPDRSTGVAIRRRPPAA
ncbi:MAG: hypothetical protein OSB43_14120 [Nocardioides sp.]|uniref:hypothetical protein n=1 Tax=Nocardioides sp. TaxID=35761 RepID=UPI00238D0EFC|nr:hypothetical protein [Nocardioides sp.]MDE0777407.1 hypothetical protein [Nocardioides sp.]